MEKLVLVGVAVVKEIVIMAVIVWVHVRIIVHTIVVNQIAGADVFKVLLADALIALVKEPTLVVVVVMVAKSGVTLRALENVEVVMVTVLTVVLVPPIQDLIEITV